MKDLISRQAAIDAIGKTSDELYENIKKGATFPQRQWFDGMAQAQSILENLPSAQPSGPDNLVKDSHGLAKELVNGVKEFEELKVIDLNGRPYYSIIYLENGNEFEGYSSYDLKVISEYLKRYFGFAQPERQKGEWIDYTEDGYVECPFCHNATNCDGNKDELHFCFSCGADMREVSE